MVAMTMVMTNAGGLLDSAGPLITPDMTSPPPRRPSIRQRMRAAWEARVTARVREAWQDPSKKPKMVRRLRIASVVLGVAVVVGGYFALRPRPQPDYLDAGMDDILDYTLLTEEFNKLPVKERLALISQLVMRLKGMDSGDSAMMAAFAAGIAGSARDQLMSNVSHLAIDIWDEYAVQYDDVPAEAREKFLEDAFLDFTKSMESVAGVTREGERRAAARACTPRCTARFERGARRSRPVGRAAWPDVHVHAGRRGFARIAPPACTCTGPDAGHGTSLPRGRRQIRREVIPPVLRRDPDLLP
jgi:hypothetical protein